MIGVFAQILMLRFVFGYAWKKKRTWFWSILGVAVPIQLALLLGTRAYSETTELLQELFSLLCSVVFPYTILQYKRKRTFFMFSVVYCATIDYIVFLIPTDRQNTAYLLTESVVIGLIILFWKVWGIRAPSDFLEQIPAWLYMVVFVADLNAYYSGMLNRDTSYYAEVSAALRIVSFAMMAFGVGYIVHRYLSVRLAEQQAKQQIAAQLRFYEEYAEKNRAVRAFRHDYENNLISLGVFLDAGQIADAQAYVQKLQGDVQSTANAFTTGNYLADAILSQKAAQAAGQQIEIDFSGTVPKSGIDHTDLCSILCNLLDNAICAAKPSAPCRVELVGRETADSWKLTVRNPVKKRVPIRGGTIRTSKADRENHGIGLTNVKRSAENYGGYLELQCDDRCFTAEVGMMLNTEEKR